MGEVALSAAKRSKLARMRLSVPISQSKLARMAGLDRKTVSDAENGKTFSRDTTFAKLAIAFTTLKGREVSEDDLVD